MEAAGDDPRIGSIVIDRYRIDEVVSSGAMGVIYRGERVGLGRQVAVKFLHSHIAEHGDFIRRFENEAQTMSRLDHPNCVSVIDYGVEEGPFIVMDFVTGNTLRDVIERGPLSPPRAISIASQVLAGLAHAHERGIIHRDVKPENIMLTDAMGAGDHVRILDFGLAKLRDADQSMSGVVVGTPSYMSPEQASYKKLDVRTDVYSAGVLIFELLAGQKPFYAEEAFEMIRLHLEAPPPAIRDRRPEAEVSEALEASVAAALAKDPEERYPSALAFARALEACGAEGAPASAEGGSVSSRGGPASGAWGADGATAYAEEGSVRAGGGASARAGGKAGPQDALAATVMTPASERELASGAAAQETAGELVVQAPADDADRNNAPPARAPGEAAAEAESADASRAVPAARVQAPRARRGRGWIKLAVLAATGAWIAVGAPGWRASWTNEIGAGARGLVDRVRGGGDDGERDRGAPSVASVEDARALADQGRVGDALRGLHDLRREGHDDAEVFVAMAELYFERDWFDEGLTALSQAIEDDEDYAGREDVTARALEAHARPESRAQARALLHQIGPPALPGVRAAAEDAERAEDEEALRAIAEELEASARRPN